MIQTGTIRKFGCSFYLPSIVTMALSCISSEISSSSSSSSSGVVSWTQVVYLCVQCIVRNSFQSQTKSE